MAIRPKMEASIQSNERVDLPFRVEPGSRELVQWEGRGGERERVRKRKRERKRE